MEWLLVVKIGLFMGLPKHTQYYEFKTREQCSQSKKEYIKDSKIDDVYTIICVPNYKKDN